MTILIAEDDPVSTLILRRALEGPGREVLAVRDGQAAWDLLRDRDDIRVVISDWQMPGIDGLELCRRLRASEGRPYTYFILLTARSYREDRLAGLAAGADDFLSKPVDRAELLARINVALRLLSAQQELVSRSRQLEELHTELRVQNERLAELATSDSLTGLKNHRHFRLSLDAAFSFSGRHAMPLSLIMLDVDHFKSYNDTFGHPAGDEILLSLSQSLREAVREHDVVARYGGEEFGLILPAADAPASRAIGERIRRTIASKGWPHRGITASLGIATTGPHIPGPSDLLDLADRALYRSKAAGRNRVTHDSDASLVPIPPRPVSPRFFALEPAATAMAGGEREGERLAI